MFKDFQKKCFLFSAIVSAIFVLICTTCVLRYRCISLGCQPQERSSSKRSESLKRSSSVILSTIDSEREQRAGSDGGHKVDSDKGQIAEGDKPQKVDGDEELKVDIDEVENADNDRGLKVDSDKEQDVDSDLEVNVDKDKKLNIDSDGKLKVDSDDEQNLDGDKKLNVDRDEEQNVDSDTALKVDSEEGQNIDRDGELTADRDKEQNVDSDKEHKIDSDEELVYDRDKNPRAGSGSNITKDHLVEEFLKSRSYKVLNADARLIVQAVLEARFHQVDTPELPGCKGDRLTYEVEDLFCMPRPKYLKEVKNPCWWEQKSDGTKSLRCVPYFHILGCEKCGSSDLWNRIASHPHVFRIKGIKDKEASWWSWGRYAVMNYQRRPLRDFKDYTKSFTTLTKAVESSMRNQTEDYKYIITGDATPSDLTDFRGWVNISQNRGLKHPEIITPHLMKHIYSNPKFIIIYRNPVTRFYSEYYYVNGTRPKNPHIFHRRVLDSISMLASCVRRRGIRDCAFDHNVYHALPLRLQFFFYSLYIPEWLKVFPRESFLILKTEEYSRNIQGTLKSCMKFLGLEPLPKSEMEKISQEKRANVGKPGKRKNPMLKETRKLLEAMAGPTTRVLAEMLGDERFAWYQEKPLGFRL